MLPFLGVSPNRFPGVPMLHGAWRDCQGRRSRLAEVALTRPKRDVPSPTPGRLCLFFFLLLCGLCLSACKRVWVILPDNGRSDIVFYHPPTEGHHP